MGDGLTRFQDGFARALFASPGDPAPEAAALTAQPGFAVYRNTVMKGCVDALEANYPAVTRITGGEWMRSAAALFARAHPPSLATLLYYGEGFETFLRQFEHAAEFPYLPGVARLDRYWTEAHVARSAAALDSASLGGLAPEVLAQRVLHPHPAARWIWFDDAPVYSIWSRNREQAGDCSGIEWKGEGALLTRPVDSVHWRELDAAGCAFLNACARGRTLGEAAAIALETNNDADLALLMASLLDAGAFAATVRA